MKPWIRRTLIAVIGVAAIGSIAACSHGPRHCRGPMSDEQMGQMKQRVVERATRELNLNTEQQGKLTALADTLAQQRKALRGTSESPQAALAPIIAGPKFDRAAAQALADAKVSAVQTGGPSVINAAGDFYDSLDAEQQAKVRTFMERGGRHRFGFFGRD